jgi:hypothetical protein
MIVDGVSASNHRGWGEKNNEPGGRESYDGE